MLLYLIRFADKLNIDLSAAAVEEMRVNAVKYPVANHMVAVRNTLSYKRAGVRGGCRDDHPWRFIVQCSKRSDRYDPNRPVSVRLPGSGHSETSRRTFDPTVGPLYRLTGLHPLVAWRASR